MAIIITDDDVRKHMPMEDCIEAMRIAFTDFADGRATSPPRLRYLSETPDPDRTYFCNVHVGAVPSVGMACVRAGSHAIQYDPDAPRARSYPEGPNWTVVILYDLATAEPLGFLHESWLSGIRVAATSGAVVAAVARDDVTTLGIFGAGRQARAHCDALCRARPSIKRVHIYSPTEANRTSFPDNVDVPGVEVIPVDDPKAAVEGMDIVCSASASSQPTFDGNWLCDGQLVVSIANSDPKLVRHEVDETTVTRAKTILLNHWESVETNKQVEILEPLAAGKISRESIVEIGEVFSGRVSVRQEPDSILYYKNNTGLGMQFAAAGAMIYEKMKDLPNNKEIPAEWLASESYSQGGG